MEIIYKQEMKLNIKNVLIWFICVGGMGFACIMLFSSMKGDMESMAENFASMGAFSNVFGMNQLSIATLSGFYATEVGTIHSLGGAMFAAIISTNMLSKEEDGHTSEFLYTLPIARRKVISAKWGAVLSQILLFNLLCAGLYLLGIVIIKEEMSMGKFVIYHMMQVLMHTEIAGVCYAVSAFLRKNKLGLGLGIVLLLYAYDLIARVIPDMSDAKMVSPFSYANAADILSSGEIDVVAVVIGVTVLAVAMWTTYRVYVRRDLMA